MRGNTWLTVLALAACGPTVSAGDNPDAAAAPIDSAPAPPDATPLGPVTVSITADNAYSFGYGDSTVITHFTQGARATVASQIFGCPVGNGPELYVIPEADAPDTAFLYVISWDDEAVTQGVLGQFKRLTAALYTGDAQFQVCATGLDYSGNGPVPAAGDPTNGPTLAVINEQIGKCNDGSGDAATSKGWVDSAGAVTPGALGRLAVGEANDDPGGTFPLVCPSSASNPDGIDAAARWMWYFPDDGGAADAFHSNGSNRFKAFLIFRLGVDQIHIGREI